MKKLGLLSLFLACAVLSCDTFDESVLRDGTARVPPKIPGTSSPNDSVEVLFALRNIFLKQNGEQGRNIGLDLDGRNSQSVDNVECRAPDDTASPVLDGTRGIDNALGLEVLGTLPAAVPCIEDDLMYHHGRGEGTIMILLRKWNGLENDDNVEVTITRSWEATSEDPEDLTFGGDTGTELVKIDCTPVPPATYCPAANPIWDADPGTDYWYIDRNDFDGADITDPIRPQDGSYVTRNRLVVPLIERFEIPLAVGVEVDPETEERVSKGKLDILLSDGFLFADMVKKQSAGTDGGANEEYHEITFGAIAGRFAIEDLKLATPALGICNPFFAAGQNDAFDAAADVMTVPGTGGPEAECNAVSIGISFTGLEGRLAGFAEVGSGSDALPLDCGVAGTEDDPVVNTCCPGSLNQPEGCDDSVYRDAPNFPVKPPDFATIEAPEPDGGTDGGTVE